MAAVVVPGGGAGGGTTITSTFVSGGTFDALVSIQASLHVESGIDSSGLIKMPSGFFASGLVASARIEGTIGQFLATALAGSGLNASGPVGATSGDFAGDLQVSQSVLVGSDLYVSGSALVGSNLYVSGSIVAGKGFNASGNTTLTSVSATDIEVSTINGLPPGTVTSTFPSGLTACALMSVDASAIFRSYVEVSGTVSVGGPLNAASTVSILGVLRVSMSTTINSALDVSGQLTVGKYALFGSGEFQNQLATDASVIAASVVAVQGSLVASGQTALESALQVSGRTTLFSTLEVSGAVSAGGDVTTPSLVALSVIGGSGLLLLQPPSTFASAGRGYVSIGLPTGAQASFLIEASIGNSPGIFRVTTAGCVLMSGDIDPSGVFAITVSVNQTLTVSGAATLRSTLEASGGVSIGGSVAVASALSVLGALRVSGAAALNSTLEASGAVSIGGTTRGAAASFQGSFAIGSSLSALGNLRVSGTAVVNSSLEVSAGISAGGDIKANIDVSAPSGNVFAGIKVAGLGLSIANAFVSGNLSVAGSLYVQSNTTTSAPMSVMASFFVQSVALLRGPTRFTAFKSVQNGQVSAVSAALVDFILVGSNATSVLLPCAATVSGKEIQILTSAGGSAVVSVVADAGDNIEGLSGITISGTPSFAKIWLYTPGSTTWYNIGSGLQ